METKTQPKSGNDSDFRDGKLYNLLLEKLPTEFIKYDRIDTDRLCKTTGNARFTIYRWFNEQRLSPKAAGALFKISQETEEAEKKGLLTREDLVPFVVSF